MNVECIEVLYNCIQERYCEYSQCCMVLNADIERTHLYGETYIAVGHTDSMSRYHRYAHTETLVA